MKQIKSIKNYIIKTYHHTLINLLTTKQKKNKQTLPSLPFQLSPKNLKIHQQNQQHHTKQLTKLLNKLPKKQKKIIYLHFYNQLSFLKITKILKINYQTIHNYTSKTIHTLTNN